jgi:transcriptional regulator with XRE-family HTH domain
MTRKNKEITTVREHDADLQRHMETAIGNEVRSIRLQLGLTVKDLVEKVNLSPGSLSKIENGLVYPSIPTLIGLADAMHIPVTSFFRKFDQQRDVTYVRAGGGLTVERAASQAGHLYQLLGHTLGARDVAVEPYLITLSEKAEAYPIFQHSGVEFLFMLDGKMEYRHGNRTFTMSPGDSLFFDSDITHGPKVLLELPIRFLTVIVYSWTSESRRQ